MSAEPCNVADRLSYRALQAGDLALLEGWMQQPHWREWWGEPEEELGLIRDMIAGRDTTRPYIFSVDGKPKGYIQVWFIGDHQNQNWISDHPWLAALPADAVGVDLSIGEAGDLAKGLGSAILHRFADDLTDQGHRTIIIDPDPDNARAIRAYEKAGFHPVPHLHGQTGDTLIMQFGAGKNEPTS